jgi:hypothetical protein
MYNLKHFGYYQPFFRTSQPFPKSVTFIPSSFRSVRSGRPSLRSDFLHSLRSFVIHSCHRLSPCPIPKRACHPFCLINKNNLVDIKIPNLNFSSISPCFYQETLYLLMSMELKNIINIQYH